MGVPVAEGVDVEDSRERDVAPGAHCQDRSVEIGGQLVLAIGQLEQGDADRSRDVTLGELLG